MNEVLSPVEARALGALMEKEFTTPDYYPLSLHALTAACNQKSNRDPAMSLGEEDVTQALDTLREKRLAWQTTGAGARVAKFKHDAATVLGLAPRELAILCELLIRGPQTLGELRTHAARLCEFADLAAVETALQGLVTRESGALVVKLPRETGRRESRYAHLLCGDVKMEAPAGPGPAVQLHADESRITVLEREVAALRAELAEMNKRLDDVEKSSPTSSRDALSEASA